MIVSARGEAAAISSILTRAVARLDLELETDAALLEAEVELELRQQVVDEVHVRGVVHLRDHDAVELRAGALDDVGDVAPAPPRGDAVDAHDLRLRASSPAQRVDDVLAGRVGLLRSARPRPRGRGRPGRRAACGPSRASCGLEPGTARQDRRRRIRDAFLGSWCCGSRRGRAVRSVAWTRCAFCSHGTATRRAGPTIAGRRDDPLTRARPPPGARARAATSRRCGVRRRGSSRRLAVRARADGRAPAREALGLDVSESTSG